MTVHDDEIDLRPYIQAIIHKWWAPALLAIVGLAIGFLITYLQPEVYEVTATMLLTRQKTQLSLSEDFTTVTEATDITSRINTILTIAKSDAIALAALQELQTLLPPGETLGGFKDSFRLTVFGQAINLIVTAPDSTLAAKIANTLAERIVRAVNVAYQGEGPLVEIQAEREVARQNYSAAQTNVELFIQSSPMLTLTQQINELQAALESHTSDRTWALKYYGDRRDEMARLLVTTESLKAQLNQGGRSSAGDLGDAIAVLFARTSLMVSAANLGRMDISNVTALRDTPENYRADLDTLITLISAEKAKAEEKLVEATQTSLESSRSQSVDEIAQAIKDLQMNVENAKARQKEIENKRDLAWSVYKTLLEKETEIENAPKISNTITLVSEAVAVAEPAPRGTLTKTLIGGALGLVIGLVVVVGIEWWRHAGVL